MEIIKKYIIFQLYVSIEKNDTSSYDDIFVTNLSFIECKTPFTIPESNQSWRWCNTKDEFGEGYHWHRIVDSDTLKALRDAANAQDTADGKRRVYLLISLIHHMTKVIYG